MYNNYGQCFLSPTVRHAPDSLCDFNGICNLHQVLTLGWVEDIRMLGLTE